MSEAAQEPLWDRTIRRLREIWPLGDPITLKEAVGADLSDSDRDRVRKKIDACLEGTGGEVSARARAAEIGEAYLVLSPTGRRRFLELLAREYDIDRSRMKDLVSSWLETDDDEERERMIPLLREVLEPPRAQLLRQFNGLRGGVKFLVDLRAELMVWAGESPSLRALDKDVFRLLELWFDAGFLDLQQITWNTPAALLEKLIRYEAVHEITSWQDLKNRLEEDRRCYAFFHPRMPDEPLIFVEVALVNGISASIHELLDEKGPDADPEQADTAIFYSISNCQRGLAGVSFGNLLIKKVVADLSSSLPNLKTFSTLSPIPGFAGWLETAGDELELSESEHYAMTTFGADDFDRERFVSLLQGQERSKPEEETARQLQQGLLGLCSRYLLEAKRGQQAYDRVAHFHLTNGAQIRQINWAADLSPKGVEQSAGMMVNYLYDLSLIEKRHEDYSSHGKIAVSSAVRKLQR